MPRLLAMISELYADSNRTASIVDMDVSANILSMTPSISGGGLCISTALRGELLDPLGFRKARVRVADTTIKVYLSYPAVLPYSSYPGDYVFITLHSFTIPRAALVGLPTR